MTEFLFFLLGGSICSVGVLLWERAVRAKKKRLDEQEYKSLWSEAVTLLGTNGQLTDEQISKITPKRNPKPVAERLPRGKGFSIDRREVEIARAQQGLPPADNLEGMFSDDVRAVMLARIKYGTGQ